MRIKARGLRRNRGVRTLVEADLGSFKVQKMKQGEIHYLGEDAPDDSVFYVWPQSDAIEIAVIATNVKLGGDYEFYVNLSREEIGKLFVLAFRDRPMSEIAKLFRK